MVPTTGVDNVHSMKWAYLRTSKMVQCKLSMLSSIVMKKEVGEHAGDDTGNTPPPKTFHFYTPQSAVHYLTSLSPSPPHEWEHRAPQRHSGREATTNPSAVMKGARFPRTRATSLWTETTSIICSSSKEWARVVLLQLLGVNVLR